MSKTIATILLLALLCWPGRSQTEGVSPTADTPENPHAAYVQLNRQIFARHGDAGSGVLNDSEDKYQAASRQLNRMIAQEIELALATAKPSATSITAAVAKLQGEFSLSAWDPDETNTPFASLFTLNGIQSAAVAYVIMQGGEALPDTQPYLRFYDKGSGAWQQRATAPTLSDFEHSDFSVGQLNSAVSSEAWFLAWGGRFGNSHASINVRLYAFDGTAVRTIWKRDRLDAGKVTPTSDTVTLNYLDDVDRSIEKHEVLRVTPNGLLPQ